MIFSPFLETATFNPTNLLASYTSNESVLTANSGLNDESKQRMSQNCFICKASSRNSESKLA